MSPGAAEPHPRDRVIVTRSRQLLKASLAAEDVVGIPTGPFLEWPPGRNDPCWCGSRAKYKKCCYPRTR